MTAVRQLAQAAARHRGPALDSLGCALLSASAWLLTPAAGLAVAGLACLALSAVHNRTEGEPK